MSGITPSAATRWSHPRPDQSPPEDQAADAMTASLISSKMVALLRVRQSQHILHIWHFVRILKFVRAMTLDRLILRLARPLCRLLNRSGKRSKWLKSLKGRGQTDWSSVKVAKECGLLCALQFKLGKYNVLFAKDLV